MRRLLLTVGAALALAGCTDVRSSSSPMEPSAPRFSSGQTWRIFSGLSPASTIDATGGWEIATRFYVTVPGCIAAFHFYRASGETGTNKVRLWTNSGDSLYALTIAGSGETAGWHTINHPQLGFPLVEQVCLQPYTWYRVSTNTNSKQVKTFGYLSSGPIVRGPLVADQSYYGQPTGSMPTTPSSSIYFVDITFEES